MTTPESLLEKARAAMPGEWKSVDGVLAPDDDGNARSYIRPVHSDGWQIVQSCGPNGEANAAYIAALSPAAMIPLLEACEAILEADQSSPHGGLPDCRDNSGAAYQSQWLADHLNTLRTALRGAAR